MENIEMITCKRCGAPMKSNQRYCMKCGYLNYDHPDNQSLLKYKPKNGKKINNVRNIKDNAYEVGQGMGVNTTGFSLDEENNQYFADKAGNRTLCVVLNVIFYIFLLSMLVILWYFNVPNMLFDWKFYVAVIILTLFSFYNIAFQFLYMKANKPWWSLFIPFYNIYIFFEIAVDSGVKFLISLIPIVGQIYLIYVYYNLGRQFEKSGLFSLFLFPIFLPVEAFKVDSTYKGINYVPHKNKNNILTIDKVYKSNKRLMKLFGFVCIVCVAMIVYINYDHIKLFVNTTYNKSFINDSDKVLKEVKKSVETSYYSCSNGLSIRSQNGPIYIPFEDASRDYNIELKRGNNYMYGGYVKILDGKYYIAIGDGEKGINETEDIKNSLVIKDYKADVPDGAVTCHKN